MPPGCRCQDSIPGILCTQHHPTLWNCAEAACPAACHLLCCCLSCSYRILYNNVVCVAWLTYLSLLTHTKINILSFLHLTH